MASSHQTHGGQQLQHQRFGPGEQDQSSAHGSTQAAEMLGLQVLPWVPVVEAQRDLVDTGGMFHHQVEARLANIYDYCHDSNVRSI